jgi:hypothetical protein
MTELLLALIASLLAVIAIILTFRKPSVQFYEDEHGSQELANAIHNLALRVRLTDNKEVQVTQMPREWTKAMERVQSTAIDMQGIIDLFARYLIQQMPRDSYKDLFPPDGWITKEDLDTSANSD